MTCPSCSAPEDCSSRHSRRYRRETVRERSQWLKNLEADDTAGVWFCGTRHDAKATVERGPLNVVELRTDDTSPAG